MLASGHSISQKRGHIGLIKAAMQPNIKCHNISRYYFSGIAEEGGEGLTREIQPLGPCCGILLTINDSAVVRKALSGVSWHWPTMSMTSCVLLKQAAFHIQNVKGCLNLCVHIYVGHEFLTG